jgi:hypothetical protein
MAARSIPFDSRYSWMQRPYFSLTTNASQTSSVSPKNQSRFRLIALTGCEDDDEDLREIKAALESLEVLKQERLSKPHR